MTHAPTFTFRTRGGLCAGEQWICDGDEPIARFEHVAVEQPEQNLRYFDRNPRPVNLRDLKLAPGARPLVAGVQLYWNLGAVITTELVGVAVRGQGTACLVLEVTTRDPGGVALSRRVVTVTYDAALSSYVYDFQAHLLLHSPELYDGQEEVRFECSDPWYCDVPGPTVEFPGMWPKRYSHLLAQEADGAVWQMPLNHLATGIRSPRALAPDGLLVLARDPGHNPAFEFVGDTGPRTGISVCNWGYDIHIATRFGREELYRPMCSRFRVRLCPDAVVDDLMARAAPVPPVVYGGFAELPLYERHTSFEKGQRLDQPTPGATDPWPWLPAGEGAAWCRTEGRSDSCSLKIARASAGPTEWVMNREGVGAWAEPWRAGSRFRVSVWARTEGVCGRGACLAVRWAVYNYPERYPYHCSQRLVGTHGWTRLEVELSGPAPADVSAISLILRQDGAGTTWFDDLDVEVLGVG
ncbi:MAG: hypothetical protein ABIL09_23835 [Gemmatimonadota bacterium]